MIIVPVNKSLLYIEPVYQVMLNESEIPVLKKVIVASGNTVAIGDTLEAALVNLFSDANSVDLEFIKKQLSKRRPSGKIETPRVEMDNFHIVSGIFNGYTTGEAISLIIENNNVKSKDYEDLAVIARPSHADYVAYKKSHGFNDYRGGGHFSGRITAAIVASGAILIQALSQKGIKIATHIKQCYDILDRDFSDILEDIDLINNKSFPVLDNIEENIIKRITEIANKKDSVGGILQTAIVGLPVGLGDPWFSSVEGKLANALFSIGGIKGVEFGQGFNYTNLLGSEANDEFYYDGDIVKTKTNNNAGINGGITNGMPIIFNCAVKPTPSIGKNQNTINFKELRETNIEISGRHDPAIVRRIAVVIDSICAFVIADLLAKRYGDDFLNF